MKTWLWVVISGALARLAMVMFHPVSEGLQRLEPSIIAANLNAGRGFTFEQYGAIYHAWKEPLYIGLLAVLTRWFGEYPLPVLLFQGLFGIATAVGVAMIARRMLGDSTKATVAGVIASANPFLVFYDTQRIHPLSMDAFLFIATTGAVLVAVMGQGDRLRRSLIAGLVTGVALWQRATLMAAVALAWCVGVVREPVRHRARLARWAGGSLLLALVIVSPWLIRNHRVLGHWAITTDAAHVFWLGNNPWSNGTYSDQTGTRVFWIADPAFRERIYGAPELAQQRMFLEATRRFIADHPGRFVTLVLRRLLAFVWFSPNAGVEYTPWQQGLYLIYYSLLLACGLIGVRLCWWDAAPERRQAILVVLGAVAGVAAVHAVTAINLKHRVPLELILTVFSAETVCRTCARVSQS